MIKPGYLVTTILLLLSALALAGCGTLRTRVQPSPTPVETVPPVDARPTATLTSTPVPPTPDPVTPTPSGGPQITSFEVSPTQVEPGETVTLTWEAHGDKATLCPSGRYVLFTEDDCRSVPLAGEMTFTIPMDTGGNRRIDFLLTVEKEGVPEPAVGQTSTTFRCDTTWFYSDEPQAGVCPREPTRSDAVAQHFERGTMIWLQELGRYFVLEDVLLFEGEIRKRVTLLHDPLEIVRDTSDEVAPPPGRYAPGDRFGPIWRGDVSHPAGPEEVPPYRTTLGWALAPESRYEAVWQCDDAPPSGGRSWQTCALAGPESEVIVLHPLGGWYLLSEQRP